MSLTRFHFGISIFVIGVSLNSLAAPKYSNQEIHNESSTDQETPLEESDLAPDEAASRTLNSLPASYRPRFIKLIWPDGSMGYRVTGFAPLRSKSLYVEFAVNLSTGTVSIPKGKGYLRPASDKGKNGTPYIAQDDVGITAGNWVATTTIATKDPILLTLAKTTNRTYYTTYPDKSVRLTKPAPLWWSANPTPPPLNTHWYVSQKSTIGPIYKWDLYNGYTVSYQVNGGYYNLDWRNPTLSTVAGHSIINILYGSMDGSYQYSADYRMSGEDCFLLFGVISTGD